MLITEKTLQIKQSATLFKRHLRCSSFFCAFSVSFLISHRLFLVSLPCFLFPLFFNRVIFKPISFKSLDLIQSKLNTSNCIDFSPVNTTALSEINGALSLLF
uniref:Uncharacterized protein n=1 Tax=Sphaerodactylus townsendi TaxID=933632 RepID=A0ACB8ERN3_9SAUR